MLARTDLERIARTVSHENVGHAETLYLQDIVLSTVSRETADELVFKGGTALMKFYQLDRFSEDLDFTARESVDLSTIVDAAVRDLGNYGATVAERTEDDSAASFHARLGIEGPLYTGDPRSLCFLRVEANKESTVTHVHNQRYTPRFPDIPSFELAVLADEEILAEKIRALVTRQQPRDLYDIYHLVEKAVEIRPALVQDKLDYYDLEYDPNAVVEAVTTIETGWETLDPLVYSTLPSFDEVFRVLERTFAVTD